ncbi:MAG: hypothetical protein JWM16_1901 [Verrucomicrobiales bacterium]|nr:hypothetical protein [Verrucomicrobiales bacterium]
MAVFRLIELSLTAEGNTPYLAFRSFFNVCRMQTTLFPFSRSSTELDITSTIQVVIAFEDLAAGKRAKQVYDYLTHRLTDFEFDHEVWKFSALECPSLTETAARQAAAADIIMLSLHGNKEIPQSVKDWIETWIGQNGNPMALVVLFDRDNQEFQDMNKTRLYLEDVARRGKLDLFMQPQKSVEAELEATKPADFSEDFAEVGYTSIPRFGIND